LLANYDKAKTDLVAAITLEPNNRTLRTDYDKVKEKIKAAAASTILKQKNINILLF
jgi:hypothetical protein